MKASYPIKFTLVLAVNLALFIAMAEFFLRVFPGVIPLTAMRFFTRENQSRIAQARNLPNLRDSTPVDDGQPLPLLQRSPGALVAEVNVDLNENFSNRMDTLGFCNPSWADPGAVNAFDIVAIGDSFTYCTTVQPEGAWPALLGKDMDLDVYNLGLIGHGPEDYLRLLAYHRKALSPAAVLFAYYSGNDLRDNHRYYPSYYGVPAKPKYDLEELWQQSNLFARSYSFSVLSFLVDQAGSMISSRANPKRGGSQQAAQGQKDDGGNHSDSEDVDFRYSYQPPGGERYSFNLQNADQDEVEYARLLRRHPEILEGLGQSLDRFAADALKYRYTPVIIFMPSAYYVLPDVQFSDPALGELMMWFTSKQRDYIAAQARRLGIPFIDLTGSLRQASAASPAREDVLYNPTNRHLSPRGNQVVARILAQRLPEILPERAMNSGKRPAVQAP